jgi:hypothetical protein
MKNHTFITHLNCVKLACIALLFISFAVNACDFRKVEAQMETNSKEESNMEPIQNMTTIQPKIPPIDAAVIPETEIATFAMG